mmetsp:Transcript_21451/g.31755  ORF Transcript_21451/g.31755 Transcript_21451/m.31755 type:complete len:371 (-) Transcript_21451:69-1181(-)
MTEQTGTNSDDAMMAAFEQYMMGGKNNINNNNSLSEEEIQQQLLQQQKLLALEQQHKLQMAMRKADKRYWSIYQHFTKRILEEWLDLDDQSHKVIQAIVGIRSRLPMHSSLLYRFQEQRACMVKVALNKHKQEGAFRGYGYGYSDERILWRGDPKGQEYQYGHGHGHGQQQGMIMMEEQDVELALSHDLIQHEKMMDGLRSLFANLSECHEALLRHLDEMAKHHLETEWFEFHECYGDGGEGDNGAGDGNGNGNGNGDGDGVSQNCQEWNEFASLEKAAGLSGIMQDIMAMLSMELYRKQCLAYTILETVGDDLVGGGGNGGGGDMETETEWEDLSPKAVADRCLKQWPRDCKAGCIDVKVLADALDLIH